MPRVAPSAVRPRRIATPAPDDPGELSPSRAARMRRPGHVPAAVDQKRLRSFIDTDCVSLEAPKVF